MTLRLSPVQAGDSPEVPAARRQARRESHGDRVVLSAAAQLTSGQQQVVAQLAEIDRRVRAHEQAHLAAAGGYARGASSFTFATGPDGKLYAVGGEVAIDTSPVPGDPQQTIAKAEAVQAAANAPVDPSPQDRQVAAAAAQMEIEARLELAEQEHEKAKLAYQPGFLCAPLRSQRLRGEVFREL